MNENEKTRIELLGLSEYVQSIWKRMEGGNFTDELRRIYGLANYFSGGLVCKELIFLARLAQFRFDGE